MTYEYAAYLKLLLLCGYKDELLQYVENALAEQDPISEIVLELSTAGSDDKSLLLVLNEYLRQEKATDIDWNRTVFDLVLSFLRRKTTEGTLSMKETTDLMYRISVHTQRYHDEPWHTMYYMGDLFDEAEAGYIDKEDYQRKFELFIKDKICFRDYPPAQPKESFFRRILKKFIKNNT